MSGSVREDRVREVLDYCRGYWKRNGVPDARVNEMAEELHGHLREALEDQKTVQSVVGPDVEEFAEEWAAPNRPVRTLAEETLDVVSDAVFALAVLGILAHLALWSPTLPAGAGGVLGALLLALGIARMFAYLRAPSDEPPNSEESVLDHYPRRLYNRFMWFLLALWTIYLFLPLPDVVLFRWPVQATLALPLVAALVRGAKRIFAGRGDAAVPPGEFLDIDRTEDSTTQAINVSIGCPVHWRKMGIPHDQIDDMFGDLNDHIMRAVREGRSVSSVVGDDVEAFAEAWAEDYGTEPDHRTQSEHGTEPVRYVVMGWVLSLSACATVLATLFHFLQWTLYVPIAWILGMYLFFVAAWFGQPVADLLDRIKSWRYSPVKSMLAAGLVILLVAAVSLAMAFFFMIVGPRIPFEWPWYATVVSAFVALSVMISWLRGFAREDAEGERRRAGREYGRSEGV